MVWKALALLSMAAAALGDGHHAVSEQKVVVHHTPVHQGHHGELAHIGSHAPEQHEQYAWSHPSYEFSYRVEDPHTHDFKGQREHRDGDVVKGEYWLLQPDGRKRIVKYHADKHSGFHAEVHYEGEAHHPNLLQHKEHHEVKHKEPIQHVPVHHAPVHHEPIRHEIHPIRDQLADREQHGYSYSVHVKHEHKPHHHQQHHIPIVHHEHHEHKPHHEHVPIIHHEHKPIHHELIQIHHEHRPIRQEQHRPIRHEHHEHKQHHEEHHPHHIPLLNLYRPKMNEPYYGHRHN